MPAWPLELQRLARALLHPTGNNIFESKTNGCGACGFKGNERFVVSKQSLESFAQAARYCHFCDLITCVLRDARMKHNIDISLGGRREIYLSGANRSNEGGRFYLLADYEPSIMNDEESRKIVFYNPRDSKNPWKGLPFDEDVAQTAGSDECLNLLNQWMATCVSSHAECASEPDQPLPKRVLDVSHDRPKLIISEDLSQRNKDFIALSHCWGTSPPPRTLQGNIRAHLDGIDLATLPQTFQDAVAITRFLGLRYIWIDSLCIVQDDKLDWEREAAKMADVYGLAHLVLGASSAAGGTDGFLGKLVALSAVTRTFHERLGDLFLAGLSGEATTARSIVVFVASGGRGVSWSMATRGFRFDTTCRVIEAESTPVSDINPFGSVKGGHLVLEGWFRPATVRSHAKGSKFWKDHLHGGFYNSEEWPASSFYADVSLGTAKVEVDGDAIATAVRSWETKQDNVPDEMDFPMSNASVVVLGVSESHPSEDFFADWDVKVVTVV
ncbi:hypothetical protein CTRI78_v011208 [Colletotrichum trifolii]|uniref:Heterokaryon incompatibility domain-containing protein n=1 Tax=Colletotrichum trifolii TaxID=5466 RepID=A0A4R8QRK2_COLTR|nr:hypothetical protein CTRI78_v011208 [Colletotrichum trifolii]